MIRYEKLNGKDCKFCNEYEYSEDGKILPTQDFNCLHPEVDPAMLDQIDWDIEKCPQICNYFESKTVLVHCYSCNKEINIKKATWPHWVICEIEDRPACSKECAQKGQEHADFF